MRTPLTQNQFDALVSLVYNIGESSFAASTLLRRLNRQDFQGAADEFLKWNRAGSPPLPLVGLTRRRAVERALFLSDGESAATPRDPLTGHTPREISWIREYDALQLNDRDLDRRRTLHRIMTEQRKRIWRAAQPPERGGDGRGWDWAQRRKRYQSLLTRTS